MPATLYGLKNCDTCRKARKWLDAAGVEATFIDVRDDGVDASRLEKWVEDQGWETLLNRRSRSWREIPAEKRDDVDAHKALALMQEQPTLIKRPVLEQATGITVGFSEAQYETAFAGAR